MPNNKAWFTFLMFALLIAIFFASGKAYGQNVTSEMRIVDFGFNTVKLVNAEGELFEVRNYIYDLKIGDIVQVKMDIRYHAETGTFLLVKMWVKKKIERAQYANN